MEENRVAAETDARAIREARGLGATGVVEVARMAYRDARAGCCGIRPAAPRSVPDPFELVDAISTLRASVAAEPVRPDDRRCDRPATAPRAGQSCFRRAGWAQVDPSRHSPPDPTSPSGLLETHARSCPKRDRPAEPRSSANNRWGNPAKHVWDLA